ncbi:hypothetical protein LXL04_019333 [Taraxacum kok-saghyz]
MVVQRSSSRLRKLTTRMRNMVESVVMLDEDDDFVNPGSKSRPPHENERSKLFVVAETRILKNKRQQGGRRVTINVNPGNIRVCSGPDFLPVNPLKVNNLYIRRKYRMLTKQCNWFQLKSSFLRFTMIFTLSRFGHFKGQIGPSVKDNGDRSHEALTTVKILASNSKVSKRYESRKTAYEKRDYRLLRSRTETDVISKPELQTTNRWMFWNRHTWYYVSGL